MKKTKKKDWTAFIEAHTISLDSSRRGGIIKVDVSELFPDVEDAVMGASQNYLGGGMLGAVSGGAMFMPDELSAKEQKVFFELKEAIKQYFHEITNGEAEDWDEWSGSSYRENQKRPNSAY